MIFVLSVFWALVLLLKSFIKASIKTSTIPSFGDIYCNCLRKASFAGSALNRTPHEEDQVTKIYLLIRESNFNINTNDSKDWQGREFVRCNFIQPKEN